MRIFLSFFAGASALSSPSIANATEWLISPASDGMGERLTYESGSQVAYKFECQPDAIAITETGVTDILDLRTNRKVGDGPDAVMPEGAALMALFGGNGTPDFQPASSVKNPKGGWDLTIRLKKKDKQLRSIQSSGMISLFTTGYTTAVPIDDATSAIWKGFLKRCQNS